MSNNLDRYTIGFLQHHQNADRINSRAAFNFQLPVQVSQLFTWNPQSIAWVTNYYAISVTLVSMASEYAPSNVSLAYAVRKA